MAQSTEYQAKANAMRELAAAAGSPQTSELYLRMAKNWDELAQKGAAAPRLRTEGRREPAVREADIQMLRARVTALETALSIALSQLQKSSPEIAEAMARVKIEVHPETPDKEREEAEANAARVRRFFKRPAAKPRGGSVADETGPATGR
jgi:hypothetical protein